MSRNLIKSFALGVCMLALHGCFNSDKNDNANADKSKASVQMQNKEPEK